MKDYQDGIYFNMPEEEYHDIPYFSRSFAEQMIVDPEEAWYNSAMNPERPVNEKTPQMELGTAAHCMILEPETFNLLYTKKPTPVDYPGCEIYQTVEDLKEVLDAVGERKTGRKEELISRAMPYLDPKTQLIWDNVMQSFYQEVEERGLRILSDGDIETLAGIEKALDRRPALKELFTEGYSEVVIIWTDEETGVKCKCRIDRLRYNAVIDIKTFSLKRKKNIYRAMCDDISYERYNVQYVIYTQAIENVIGKIKKKEAVIDGDVDPEWMKKFLESEKQWFWLFIRTQQPHQCKAIEAEKRSFDGATKNAYYSSGEELFRISLKEFARCREKYGDERWVDDKPVETLMDEHVPGIMYQGYVA